jgi:hypothetical protein
MKIRGLYYRRQGHYPDISRSCPAHAARSCSRPFPCSQPGSSDGPDKTLCKHIRTTVKSGDTLWSIADNAGILMSELIKANNMTESTWLTIGQVIKIPVPMCPSNQSPGDNTENTWIGGRRHSMSCLSKAFLR